MFSAQISYPKMMERNVAIVKKKLLAKKAENKSAAQIVFVHHPMAEIRLHANSKIIGCIIASSLPILFFWSCFVRNPLGRSHPYKPNATLIQPIMQPLRFWIGSDTNC